jgi:outer membrane protein OmpA-like peptidoglycan-associated protein
VSETFEPQPSSATSIWSVATSDTPEHLQPHAQLVLHWADDPVELRDGSGNTVARLVDSQLKSELGISIGLFDRIELGAILPVVLHQTGDPVSVGLPEATSPALANLRIAVRARLIEFGGLRAALGSTGWIPASTSPYQATDAFLVSPHLIVDFRPDTSRPIVLAANLGWRFRPEEASEFLEQDDSFDWRLGAEVGIVTNLRGMLALHGSWNALAGGDNPLTGEFVAGGRYLFGDSGLSATFGVGSGFAGGYGTPDARVVSSIAYAPTSSGGSSADDLARRCTAGPGDPRPTPEDPCYGFDRDGDTIADVDDSCPDEPEDIDGFEDSDGCPDPDNDADGIADFDDACPQQPGELDRNGCPFVDDDGDGIDAAVDQCPDVPEDPDGFEDSDGCPDPDNDRDGILDVDDSCPDEPESINGVDDEDGCPDEGESAVQLTGNRIVILEKVFFDTNRAVIKPQSNRVLEQVAAVMKANPEIRLLRVEGHTDSRGSDDANLELSQRRAVAVKEFLVDRGVAAERLSARGYGESHPIADNDTRAGRAENRRVEFHIIEREVQK